MNHRADPCADFSEFVCGNYDKKIPPGTDRVSVFSFMPKMNLRTISSVLEDTAHIPGLSSEDVASLRNLQKLRTFYSSCINEVQIRAMSRQPLLDVLKKIVDLFPVKGSPFEFLHNTTAMEVSGQPPMDPTSEIDSRALSMTLGYLNKMGLNAIVSLRAKRDSSKQTGIAFELDSIKTDPFKEYYSIAVEPGAELVQDASQYDSIVYEVAKTLYLLVRPKNNSSFAVSEDASFSPNGVPEMWVNISRNVLHFEHELSKLGPGGRSVSLTQLSNMSHHIDWTLILRNALPDDVGLPSDVSLRGTIFDNFDSMLESMKKYGSLPLQIQSYLVWRVVKQLIRHVDSKYGQFLVPLNDAETKRSIYCSGIVSSSMGKMVAPFFAQKVLSEQMNATDVLDAIQKQLAAAYGRAVGVNIATKARVTKQLQESLSFVGFDNTTESSEALEDFYKSLRIANDDFLGNRMRFAAWHTENSLKGLNGFVREDQRDLLPQDVDIRYDSDGYKIQVPAGVFRPILYHDEYPTSVNYGGVGVMIAQKLALGLDFGDGPLSSTQGFSFIKNRAPPGAKIPSFSGACKSGPSNCKDPKLVDQYYCYYSRYKNVSLEDPEFYE
ncbi:18S rRNA pseudouridine methyltransferase [Mortierella alpina]|nr:18S rRNA pseudouridine methyltransferase [Mortierella alpina]